jgi:ankyrin repeat protein
MMKKNNMICIVIIALLFLIPTNIVSADHTLSLQEAIEQKNKQVFKQLISQADVNDYGNKLISPLHLATMLNQNFMTKQLIAKGANINATSMADRRTPLHAAASNRNVELCEIFLKKNAFVNAADASKSTPLHFAAQKQYRNICELLVKYGARTDLKDYKNKTPLDYADSLTKEAILKAQSKKGFIKRVKGYFSNTK